MSICRVSAAESRCSLPLMQKMIPSSPNTEMRLSFSMTPGAYLSKSAAWTAPAIWRVSNTSFPRSMRNSGEWPSTTTGYMERVSGCICMVPICKVSHARYCVLYPIWEMRAMTFSLSQGMATRPSLFVTPPVSRVLSVGDSKATLANPKGKRFSSVMLPVYRGIVLCKLST